MVPPGREPPPPGSAVEATRMALNPLLERGRYGRSTGALAACVPQAWPRKAGGGQGRRPPVLRSNAATSCFARRAT